MRTTTSKKDNILRIRIDEEMYKHLIQSSKISGVTISQYIRDLINTDYYKPKKF